MRSGHPWLFESGFARQNREGRPGDLAAAFDRKNRFLAVGLYDPHSIIRMRALAFGAPTEINLVWLRAKISEAAELRSSLNNSNTTGYRLIYGESDGLPGLIADRYDADYVVKIYTSAWIPWLKDIVEALSLVSNPQRIILRMSRNTAKLKEELYGLEDGCSIHGEPMEGPGLFKENGILFEADLIHGQKTGFFLDQRENRERVGRLAKGKDVLNVFAYTGGFSLYAAKGGAKSTASLDLSKPALAAAARNFSLNPSIANAPHELLQGDAFKVLAKLKESGRRFDMVVIDPPSFAKNSSELEKAMGAYARLVEMGLGVLRRGGTLVMASCSSRVEMEEFFALVHGTARNAKRPLREIERSGHPIDHPVGFRESAYLKCLFAAAP